VKWITVVDDMLATSGKLMPRTCLYPLGLFHRFNIGLQQFPLRLLDGSVAERASKTNEKGAATRAAAPLRSAVNRLPQSDE
jgi:hypothetical protein